jgi:hypothetical protein
MLPCVISRRPVVRPNLPATDLVYYCGAVVAVPAMLKLGPVAAAMVPAINMPAPAEDWAISTVLAGDLAAHLHGCGRPMDPARHVPVLPSRLWRRRSCRIWLLFAASNLPFPGDPVPFIIHN